MYIAQKMTNFAWELRKELGLGDSGLFSHFFCSALRQCGVWRNYVCTEKIQSVTSLVLPHLSQHLEVIGTPTRLLRN